MKNIENSIDFLSYAPLRMHYKELCDNLEAVAKVAIGSEYIQQMIPHTQFNSPVRLSQIFSDSYTTIVDAESLNSYFRSGHYVEMVRRQCLVSICAYLEFFVSALFSIMKLDERDGQKYSQFVTDFSLDIHNSNSCIRKIYYLYKHLKASLGFETSNWENVQCPRMLDEMFTIRHVIVHFGGVIIKPEHKERIGNGFKNFDNNIILSSGAIDDFVHRVTINFNSLVKKVDLYRNF